MASLPAPEIALNVDTLPDFVLVRTDQVDRGDRLRPIDPVWAAALGQIMQREGQRTPIEICRLPGSTHYTLVSGGHRHAGAEAAGIAYLRAEIVGASRDERRMREVSENLWRRDLNPIDRAAFVAEAVAIHKRRAGIDPAADGRVGSAAARWQTAVKAEAADATATMSGAYGFTDAVAAELRLSGRTVERDLMLYRRLVPSLVERLREARHPVAGNATQLRTLAKLDEGKQRRVVERLLDYPGETFAGAMAMVTPKVPTDPESKRLSAFIGTFSRMGLAEKKGALAQLAGMLPAGTSLGAPAAPAWPADHARYREEAVNAINAAIELIDGLEEDEVVKDERAPLLTQVLGGLRVTRITVAGNGFKLGAKA